LPADLTFDKIQDGGCHLLKIQFNGYNSGTIAHISTKFDANTENEVQEAVLCRNLRPVKYYI